MKIDLNRDWNEFLCALIAHRVRFVMIGGHAVAAHGEPRLTEDLDVFVEPTPANARRLRAALVEFGFGAAAPPIGLLAARDKVFMLGRKPWRIDILTGIDGVTFHEAWNSRVQAEFQVSPLFVIGRGALIKNKRAGGSCEGPRRRRAAGSRAASGAPSSDPARQTPDNTAWSVTRVSGNSRTLWTSFENVKRSEGLSSGRALDRMARRR